MLLKFLGQGQLPLIDSEVDRSYAISPSLGSSERNYHFVIEAFGKKYHLCRIGVADLHEMKRFLEHFDGKAGAFGIGGCDLGVRIGHNENMYYFHEVLKACKRVKQTPYDDGYALKRIVEPTALSMASGLLGSDQRRCLIPVGSERWPLVIAAENLGLEVLLGDLPFALGFGKLISPKSLAKIAPMIMPIVGRLPFKWLYPTGEKQAKREPEKFGAMFDWADIIAGDYHYIGKYAPARLEKKMIVTNTTTVRNRNSLFDTGVSAIVTTTPQIAGRSPGTNALWALLAVVIQDSGRELNENNLRKVLDELKIAPEIHLHHR